MMSLIEIVSDLYIISQCMKISELSERELDRLYDYKEKLIEMYEKMYKK